MAEELYYKDSEGFKKISLGEENSIEVIKVNGVAQEINQSDKSVDITIAESNTAELEDKIGDLSQLETTHKSAIVAAINELKQLHIKEERAIALVRHLKDINPRVDITTDFVIQAITDQIGAGYNAVYDLDRDGSINVTDITEYSDVSYITASADCKKVKRDIGDLYDLKTTNYSNIVAAINELYDLIAELKNN